MTHPTKQEPKQEVLQYLRARSVPVLALAYAYLHAIDRRPRAPRQRTASPAQMPLLEGIR